MKPCQVIVSFARGPVRASWLLEDIPPGPRSPRIHCSRAEASGPVKTIGENSTPAGLPVMDRQAFDAALLLARREALIATARHLRNQRRSRLASICEAELRAVVNACLAMGISNEQA
jgi:hypothetical protein